MSSRILQYVWMEHTGDGQVSGKSHAIVATLTEDEWVQVERLCDWLTRRKEFIFTNIEETAATGGDYLTFPTLLQAVANQYRYFEFNEDHPLLAEHGIHRVTVEASP